jgi:hypothetical protein
MPLAVSLQFDPRPVRVGFDVDRVAVVQFILPVFQFSAVSTIPQMLYIPPYTLFASFFMYYRTSEGNKALQNKSKE